MDTQEAYRVLQKASGIEVGDRVRVLRIPRSAQEMGWQCGEWFNPNNPSRHKMVSQISTVRNVDDEMGISVNYIKESGGDRWPFFCLEFIEKGDPPIMIGDNEVKFLDGEIVVGGETISNETVRRTYERL